MGNKKSENIEDLLTEEDEEINELFDKTEEVDTDDFLDEIKIKKDIEEEKEEKKPSNKNNQKLYVIIGGAVIGLILVVLLIVVVTGGKKDNTDKKDKNSSEEKTKEKESTKDEDKDEEDTRERIPRTEKKMQVYLVNGEYVEDSYVKEADRKGKLVVRIDIEDLDAKVLDVYPNKKYGKSEYPKFILFKDNNKIRYFSVKAFKTTTTSMSASYNKYKILVFNDSARAIFYKKDSENGIFNISTKKYLYKNSYKNYSMVGANLLEAEKDGKQIVLSLSEEKVIKDVDDTGTIEAYGNFTVKKATDGTYSIYSNAMKEIASKITKEHMYADGNKIYIADNQGSTYKIYKFDISGKQEDSSTPFDEVYMLTKNAFISRIGDQVFFGKYSQFKGSLYDLQIVYGLRAYQFKPEYSGYRDSSLKTDRKDKGVYGYFEGVQVSKEIFYNLEKNEVIETKISA